jgi:hypothetical protein
MISEYNPRRFFKPTKSRPEASPGEKEVIVYSVCRTI